MKKTQPKTIAATHIALGQPPVNVWVAFKPIRSIRLRVRGSEVRLSVPMHYSEEQARAFLLSKADWLRRALAQQAKAEQEVPLTEGTEVCVLGKPAVIRVRSGSRRGVEYQGDTLWITVPDSDSPEETIGRVFEQWWRKESLGYFQCVVLGLAGLLVLDETGEGQKPHAGQAFQQPVSVRLNKARTIWGSCTPKTRAIRLNQYLYKAPPELIQYVALHELGHLLFANHGPEFKRFLTEHMPDWKERKKRLREISLRYRA